MEDRGIDVFLNGVTNNKIVCIKGVARRCMGFSSPGFGRATPDLSIHGSIFTRAEISAGIGRLRVRAEVDEADIAG